MSRNPEFDARSVIDMPAFYRLAQPQAVDVKERTFEVVWGTGAQVRRYDFWNDEVWIEELGMGADEVDLTRLNSGAPLLDTHQRYQLSDVLGVVERAWLDAGSGYAKLRFSARDEVQPVIRDVADRVIRNLSVGYDVLEMREVGRDPKTGYRIMRVIRSSPFEISLVPVGADPGAQTRSESARKVRCAVTLQRDAGAPPSAVRDATPSIAAPAASTTKGIAMSDAVTAAAGANADTQQSQQSQPTQAPAAAPTPSVQMGTRAIDLEKERREGIENIAKINQIEPRVRDHWINTGSSIKQVIDDVMLIQNERQTKNPQVETRLGLSDKETRRFSLCRAIEATASGNWNAAGFEADCSREIAQRLHRAPSPNRFFVPWEVQERQVATPLETIAYSLMKRDMTVASAGAGGYLVETANIGFIELLRNRSVLYNMGALRMSGLVGNVTIPKQSATGSATWLANEASTLSEVNQTFVQVSASPKNVGGYTEISRQLMLQSSPAIEGIVTSDLAALVALDVDAKGLNGSGSSGQPTGVLNVSGIGSVTGTSMDYADIIEFQTDVFAGNALNVNSGYVTTGAVAGLLKNRVKFSSTASPIWDGRLESADVDGYRAMASNQMPSATMLFGDFAQVVICEWGVLEVEVNPFANFQAGIVGVRAIASIDIIVRYATAFSAASSIT